MKRAKKSMASPGDFTFAVIYEGNPLYFCVKFLFQRLHIPEWLLSARKNFSKKFFLEKDLAKCARYLKKPYLLAALMGDKSLGPSSLAP